MTTFLTSDFHFHHKRICEYSNRPWAQEDNTETLINIWNRDVQPNDTVYHLGDFSFAGSSKVAEVWSIIKRLNGKKKFIFGNHDNRSLWELVECKAWEENLQDKVEILGDYHEMKIDKQRIVLCHYPLRTWNRKHYGSYMLFGHCHGSLVIPDERTMDVGIDAHPEWKLYSWQEIRDKMSLIQKPIIDHHNSPV